MKKLILPFLFILLCACFVSSESTYPYFGGLNYDHFSDDSSLFNELHEDTEISDLYPLNDPQFIPLVADLDGDTVNEMIILAGGTIQIYHTTQTSGGVEIEPLGGFSTLATLEGNFYSNMIIYDIDNDGLKNIIVHSITDGWLYMVEWNGTHAYDEGFDLNTYFSSANPTYTSDTMIGCGDSDGCIFVYNSKSHIGAGNEYIYAQVFNSSWIGNTQVIQMSTSLPFCVPKYKNIPYGNNKYYFTYGQCGTNPSHLVDVEVNSSQEFVWNKVTNTDIQAWGNLNCRLITSLTSPALVEHTLLDSGLEVGYAYSTNSNNFKLNVYKQSLSLFDDYPEIQTADGELKSNPFVATAFTDSDNNDLCVIGYDDDTQLLDILCGSAVASGLPVGVDNAEFKFETTGELYNITLSDIYSISAHAIESKQGNGLSEVLTPFGVFELENQYEASILDVSCNLNAICDATKLWNQPVNQEVALISVDVTNIGFEDIIGISETNVYYFDDGFINQNAYLGYCTKIQPSINAIWQIHEENTIETDTISPNYYTILNGSYHSGSIINVFEYDSDNLIYQEALSGTNYVYDVAFNFLNVCDGDTNSIELTIKTSERPNGDDSRFYLYNYFSSEWDFLSTYSFDDFTEFNISLSLPSDLSSYSQNGSNLKLKHSDTQTYIDTALNSIYINYIALECSSVIEGNKTNEVKVRVKPIDPEGDHVSARVVLYNGESYAQDSGWSGDFNSGTEIPFNDMYPNVTTSGATLRIYYRDSDNYLADPNYEDFTFIVQSTGHIWSDSDSCEGLTKEEFESGIGGACTYDSDCSSGYTCISGTCIIIPPICSKNSDCPEGYVCNDSFSCVALPSESDNLLTDSAKDFSLAVGIPLSVLILIILGAIIYGIFIQPSIPNNVKLPTSIILSLLVMGISVKIGLLGFIWIVLLILAILGGIAVLVAKVVRGN